MPKRYCGNTGNEVNVAVTLMVEEILQVSLSDQEGFFVVVEVKVRHVGGTVLKDLLVSEAGVGLRLEGALGELERGELGKCDQAHHDRE